MEWKENLTAEDLQDFESLTCLHHSDDKQQKWNQNNLYTILALKKSTLWFFFFNDEPRWSIWFPSPGSVNS